MSTGEDQQGVQGTQTVSLRRKIFKNPSVDQFLAIADTMPSSDWQVRGLYYQGEWFIWCGYDYTHQQACAELGIPFDISDWKKRPASEFEIFYNPEDPTFGEMCSIHIRAPGEADPLPKMRFLPKTAYATGA